MFSPKIYLFLGAVLGGISVILGAFGAHFLKIRLSEESLAVFEVAVRYQMYHALALCLIGVVGVNISSTYLSYSGLCMVLGTLIFSGSLYLLVFTGLRYFGALTPIGGLFLIISWALLALSVL